MYKPGHKCHFKELDDVVVDSTLKMVNQSEKKAVCQKELRKTAQQSTQTNKIASAFLIQNHTGVKLTFQSANLIPEEPSQHTCFLFYLENPLSAVANCLACQREILQHLPSSDSENENQLRIKVYSPIELPKDFDPLPSVTGKQKDQAEKKRVEEDKKAEKNKIAEE